LKELVEAGLTWLRTNQQTVNALNVFPVPDGDTGINMVLTMQAAYDEIANSAEMNFGKMAHAVAHGALMGARGNSGVILSQLWRGFARGWIIMKSWTARDGTRLCRGTRYGLQRRCPSSRRDYPDRGKDAASAANEALSHTQDPLQILEKSIVAADISVEHTPELLAELKKAGVVDAVGKASLPAGGMLRYINGDPWICCDDYPAAISNELEDTLETIEPGQDYEVVIDFRLTSR